MTQEDALLRAIRAEPEDDWPRLVYADWLEERGDPRAEFIRAQCALAGLPPADPRRPGLEARAQELLREHHARWVEPVCSLLGVPDAWVTFRRGFVERATVAA